MAGDLSARGGLEQRRVDLDAQVGGEAAAGEEAASRRWDDRAGNVALQHSLLPLRAASRGPGSAPRRGAPCCRGGGAGVERACVAQVGDWGLATTLAGRVVVFPGGVPVFYEGHLIGGVGVSGAKSQIDEACAEKAVSRAGLSTGR